MTNIKDASARLPAVMILIMAAVAAQCCTTGSRDSASIKTPQATGELATVSIDTGSGKTSSFTAEVVRSTADRELGLMFRKQLPEGSGMLFVFEIEEEHAFWMKNTLIPLDMIFISGNMRVVGVVHDAQPQTLVARTAGKPSRYVLEVNGGLARRLGIADGQAVSLRREASLTGGDQATSR
ncbi:MAG: DUF192 domain-containing protein [Myxococcota bacterium]|jgi:hypothetical protein